MCLQKLPTAARDGLPVLRPEELVRRLAIREATAEVVSRGRCHSESRRVLAGHGVFRYGSPSLWRPWAVADPNHLQR